jgi:hypothetical protein
MKCGRGISQPKRHDQVLKVSKISSEGCLVNIFRSHFDLMVARSEIQFAKKFGSMKFIQQVLMTHKYWGCIVVLSINKSVEPNEEQKVLTSSFDQEITVNTSKRVSRSI